MKPQHRIPVLEATADAPPDLLRLRSRAAEAWYATAAILILLAVLLVLAAYFTSTQQPLGTPFQADPTYELGAALGLAINALYCIGLAKAAERAKRAYALVLWLSTRVKSLEGAGMPRTAPPPDPFHARVQPAAPPPATPLPAMDLAKPPAPAWAPAPVATATKGAKPGRPRAGAPAFYSPLGALAGAALLAVCVLLGAAAPLLPWALIGLSGIAVFLDARRLGVTAGRAPGRSADATPAAWAVLCAGFAFIGWPLYGAVRPFHVWASEQERGHAAA